MNVSGLVRRGLVAAVVVTVLMASAGVTLAKPGNGAARVPLGNTPFDLPSSFCGFPIHVGVVSDKEYFIHSTTLADGTLIQRFTGKLVLSFTNTDTGTSITRNVSGPGTLTFYPDGSFLFDAQGRNVLAIDPIGQADTGEPGLVFTSGHVVVLVPATGPESFTLSGTQTNGCTLLA